MWLKFARNSILLGPIDAYCLVCEIHLQDEEAASLHISKATHLKALDTIGYFEKYKSDFILKTRSGYFCEVCNALVPTAAEAGLHVAEPRHAERRDRRRLRRVAGGVLARGRLLAEDAWHGLVDDTCVLCNADYDDKRAHRADRAHVLKVLQSKLLFGDDDSAYRKIDSSSYQCLACNIIFSANTLTEHFTSAEHSTALNKCTVTNNGNNTSSSACKVDTEEEKIDEKKRIDVDEKAKHEEKNDKLLNSVADFQKNGIQIDFIHEHAYCKKCSTNVDFDFEAIERHIKDHKAAPKKENAKVILDSGANGHNKHSLFTKPVVMSDAKATATQKDSSPSVSQEKKTSTDEHGLSYKNNAQKNNKPSSKTNKKKMEKLPLLSYCDDIIASVGPFNTDIILFHKICVDFFSFACIGKNYFSGVHCLVCKVPLHTQNIIWEHMSSLNHKKMIDESLVITSLNSEFVREVKTDMYHCGFCNIMIHDWDSMENHLDSPVHKEAKSAAEIRLRRNLEGGSSAMMQMVRNGEWSPVSQFPPAMLGNLMNTSHLKF